MKRLYCGLLVLVLVVIGHVNSTKFGGQPSGASLERVHNSSNYKDGQFRNIERDVLDGNISWGKFVNIIKALRTILAGQRCVIPSVKTDLMKLKANENVLVWFGHSSYFIQLDGVKILVDPVFSEVSSPIPFFPKALPGSNVYKLQDMPEIDYLIITHDHWDHLDYETVRRLKVKTVICPLGVGAHLERWRLKNIIEMDWNESTELDCGLRIHCLPSKHFSGRGFSRNKTLWASFLLETLSRFKIFIGGDGGYSSRFAEFRKKFGRVDIAILENGQYNENWQNIHMCPEETLRAAEDLRAKALLPVHVAKFTLAPHKWNEPLCRISKLPCNKNLRLLTPMIGQKVNLKDPNQAFSKWWEQ
ncbi:MAG: MBL fold metallo-hydrolase [Holosporales bacterium]|jgi:L-ascorbate metabolism protein UlaG (beta-lactamase superfamily)|nr:MBL fold metallo-hydrolase [Holosporales bacterium]